MAADDPRGEVQGQAGCRFVLRACGDVLQAGLVYGGERAALAVPGFAAVIIVLTVGWLTVVVGLNRRIRRQAGGEL